MKNRQTPQATRTAPASSSQLTGEDTKMDVGPSAPPMIVAFKNISSEKSFEGSITQKRKLCFRFEQGCDD